MAAGEDLNILRLNRIEAEVIAGWRGEEGLPFPQEEALLKKISAGAGGEVVLTDGQLDILADWMDRAVNKGYGDAIVLTGEERRIYEEIKRLKKEMDKRP